VVGAKALYPDGDMLSQKALDTNQPKKLRPPHERDLLLELVKVNGNIDQALRAFNAIKYE
jgi:hypothetical protein